MTVTGEEATSPAGRSRRAAVSWAMAALYTGALFVGGSVNVSGSGPEVSDKLLHAIAFGGLCLVYIPVARSLVGAFRPAVLWGFAAAVGAGAALEAWQALLPHRSAELLDLLADAAGAAVAAVLVVGLEQLRRGRRATHAAP